MLEKLKFIISTPKNIKEPNMKTPSKFVGWEFSRAPNDQTNSIKFDVDK